jgi:hypothetical protein
MSASIVALSPSAMDGSLPLRQGTRRGCQRASRRRGQRRSARVRRSRGGVSCRRAPARARARRAVDDSAADSRHRDLHRDLGGGVGELAAASFSAKTYVSAVKVFSDPFYRKGPNDQGIGWNILMSLSRVGIGSDSRRSSASRWVRARPLPLRELDGIPDYQSPASGLAACVAADRAHGVQGRQPGRDLGHLHLEHLADGDQHRCRRPARAAGLPERRARAEPVRVEGDDAHPVPAVLPYMLTGSVLPSAWRGS